MTGQSVGHSRTGRIVNWKEGEEGKKLEAPVQRGGEERERERERKHLAVINTILLAIVEGKRRESSENGEKIFSFY